MAEEKLKILYLMQMLLEETDPAHPMNATQLCERMQSRYEYVRKSGMTGALRIRRNGSYQRTTMSRSSTGRLSIKCRKEGRRILYSA